MCKFVLFLFLVTLAACSDSSGDEGIQTGGDANIPKVEGVENVDIVNTHGRIEGVERMHAFYENVLNKVSSEIRIVHYTIEGDPIVTDVKYDEKGIELIHDSTRDAYGSGEITTFKCGNLVQEQNITNMSYIAMDCKDIPYGMVEILGIDYNMSQQDRFEIELKYGEDMENEINTVTNTRYIVSENEPTVKSDFKLPDSVKQEVYKRLVLTNYLAEKDLKVDCNEKGSITYNLKVHINGANRDYEWKECDKGRDATELTEIVTYLIDQSKQVGEDQPDKVVQGYVLEITDNTLLIGEQFNRLQYQWLKEEIKLTGMDMNGFVFDFTILEGVSVSEFKLGDKIQASIVGSVKGSKPGQAVVKNIMKIK